MMQTLPWITARPHRNSFELTIPYQARKGWESWALCTSDRHWDNPKSNRSLQAFHFDQARERSAPVFDFGDFFCAMQGKYDVKRSNKSDIRPEHRNSRYLDSLVDTAAAWLDPWADNVVLIASGNHEQSIKDRHETDLIERLCALLNAGGRRSVAHGGFGGWIRFKFRPENATERGGGTWQSIVAHYDHGYGGGGPVTRDTIQGQRRAVYLPDADIIFSGHTHDEWVMRHMQARLTRSGVPTLRSQVIAKIPTYKEEYGDGSSGWHCRRGAPPKPTGAMWIHFYYSSRTQSIQFNVIPAER